MITVTCVVVVRVVNHYDHNTGNYRSLPGHSKASCKVCLFVGCLTSQQHASVSQGRICSDKFTCCHTETEVADPTFYLTQSQYTDTGPTSPSADPIMPGAWQGSHWSANFEVAGMTRPGKISSQAGVCRYGRSTCTRGDAQQSGAQLFRLPRSHRLRPNG